MGSDVDQTKEGSGVEDVRRYRGSTTGGTVKDEWKAGRKREINTLINMQEIPTPIPNRLGDGKDGWEERRARDWTRRSLRAISLSPMANGPGDGKNSGRILRGGRWIR
jgi:hypothetical protein